MIAKVLKKLAGRVPDDPFYQPRRPPWLPKVWAPLVHWTRIRHVRFRERLATVPVVPGRLEMENAEPAGHVVSAGV